jgi:hypothetical protein
MTRTKKDRLLQVELKLKRLEKLIRESGSGDNVNRLHGIHDIRFFQFKDLPAPTLNGKTMLENISWNIRDEPSEAEDQADCADKSGALPKVNLSKRIFDSLVSLRLESRYDDRSYLVPVFGGTIYDVLSVIHHFIDCTKQHMRTRRRETRWMLTTMGHTIWGTEYGLKG